MKNIQLTRFVVYFAFLVFANSIAFGLSVNAAPIQDAAKTTRDAQALATKEIKLVFGKLAAAIKRKKIEATTQFMTAEAAREFMSTDLIVAVEFYQEIAREIASGEAGDDVDELKSVIDAVKKWQLDKVKLPKNYYNAESDDDFVAANKEAQNLVLKAIPKDKLIAAVSEIREVTLDHMGGLEPFVGDLDEVELATDAKSAVGTITFSDKTIKKLFGDDFDLDHNIPMFGNFLATEDGWKWNGENIERTMKAWESHDHGDGGLPELPIIKDISLAGLTVSGKSVDLKSLKGKVVVIDFWGTWCRPCVAELPTLKKIHQKFKGKGFEVIGVAADDADSLNAFFKKKPLPWDNIIDGDGIIADKFGIEYYPTTLVIDKAGNHIASNLSGKRLVDEIVKLLKLPPGEYEDFSKTLEEQDSKGNSSPADQGSKPVGNDNPNTKADNK